MLGICSHVQGSGIVKFYFRAIQNICTTKSVLLYHSISMIRINLLFY